MSSAIPAPEWRQIGETSNARVFEAARDVLVIVPHQDSADDEKTARESIDFQRRHWTAAGHRGAVLVWMDPVLQQDAGARAVYANETAGHPSTCFALVSESLFAQASAAVFTGLAKPAVPTRIFATFDEAVAWAREMNAAHGGPA